MEMCNQKDLSVFDKFGIITTCSGTYFLEIRACTFFKLAIKGSFRLLFYSKNGGVQPKKIKFL